MELRRTNVVYTPEKRSPQKTQFQSPLPTSQQKLSFASESVASTAPSPDQCRRRSPSRVESFREVGVITSVTSKYYLVRAKTNWVPILKGNLLHPDRTSVDPSTDFSKLKFKKVRIADPTSYTTIAVLGEADAPETARLATNCDTERICSPDISQICESYAPLGLVEQYEELVIHLMTDIVALSRIIEAPCRGESAREFLRHEKSKIEKRVERVVAELEQIDTPASAEMKKVFLDLLHNLNDRVVATCEYCHVAKYDVRLSCGHKYCTACQRKLVQKILSGRSMVKCFLCKADLTKIDQRLVALEMYYHRPRANCNRAHEADTTRGLKSQHGHIRTASQGTVLTCSVCHKTFENSENVPVALCCTCCRCRSNWDCRGQNR